MSLKISFESDVKGFERVQRALESQQKVLNDNAESVERLGKAYAGVSKETNNIRGMESFKAAAGQVKDLTGALDTLIKNQSGLKGFIGLFSEFGREMGKMRMDAGTEIFKSMTTQLDTLRNSMKSTTSELSILKDKLGTAKKEGRLADAQDLSQQIAEKTTSQIAEGDIFSNLRNKVRWHQRHGASAEMADVPGGAGWFKGGFGGGVSGAGLKTGVTGFVAGTVALNRASTGLDQAIEMGHRGREAQFFRSLGIAQDTAGGNIGRQAMLNLGEGQEAEWMSGQWTGRNILRGVKLGTRQFLSWMGAPFGGKALGTNELKMEEANRLNELEKSRQYGYNEAGKYQMGLAGTDISNEMEMMYGMGSNEDYLKSATAGIRGTKGTRIPVAEANKAAEKFAKLGIMPGVMETMKRRAAGLGPTADNAIDTRANSDLLQSNRKKQFELTQEINREKEALKGADMMGFRKGHPSRKVHEERLRDFTRQQNAANANIADIQKIPQDTESYYKDLGNFIRDPKYLGISEEAQGELFRQYQRRESQNLNQGMDKKEASNKATQDTFRGDIGVFRGAMGTVGGDVAAAKTAQDYAASIQARFSNPMEATTAAGPMLAAMNASAEAAKAAGLTPGEQVAISTKAQNNLQNAPAFSFQDQATSVALSKLGINWGSSMTVMKDMLSKGNREEVGQIISERNTRVGTGETDINKIMEALNQPHKDKLKLQEVVLGGADINPELKNRGYGTVANFFNNGFDYGASGTAAGQRAMEGVTNRSEYVTVAEPRKVSGGAYVAEAGADKENKMLAAIQQAEISLSGIGDRVANALYDIIGKGFSDMGNKVLQSIGSDNNNAGSTDVSRVTGTVEPVVPSVSGRQMGFE